MREKFPNRGKKRQSRPASPELPYESIISLDEKDKSLRFQLANVLHRAACVEYSFDAKRAEQLNSRSIELFDGLVSELPNNFDYRFALAKALEDDCFFGQQRNTLDSNKRAEASGKRCLEIRRTLQIERAAEVQNKCNVLARLGLIAESRGEHTAATDYLQQGIQNATSILAKFPSDLDALGAHVCCYAALARLPTCDDRERMLKESIKCAEAQTSARRNFSAGRY
jgi:hypothetical protein